MLSSFVVSISPKAHHPNYSTFLCKVQNFPWFQVSLFSGFLRWLWLSRMPEHVLLVSDESVNCNIILFVPSHFLPTTNFANINIYYIATAFANGDTRWCKVTNQLFELKMVVTVPRVISASLPCASAFHMAELLPAAYASYFSGMQVIKWSSSYWTCFRWSGWFSPSSLSWPNPVSEDQLPLLKATGGSYSCI